MARNAAAGGVKSEYRAEPYDWYVDEDWCAALLLEAESFMGEIADPACGCGMTLRAAHARGFKVMGSDIMRRAQIFPFCFDLLDFLAEPAPEGVVYDNVMCNPPYSYVKGIAVAFIRRALRVTRHKVAMLLPVKFLSSQERFILFNTAPPKAVYVLSSRPSMPPGSMLFAGEIAQDGGKVDYCWIVWERGFRGETSMRWMIRPDHLTNQLRKQEKAANGR